MSQRFICALLTTGLICCTFAENNEFATTSEFVKKQPTEDKLLANIVGARNSSKAPHPKGNDSAEEYEKSLDKQPRIASHRVESESRDKSSIQRNLNASKRLLYDKLKRASSSCCGSRYGSNSSTRPDSYYGRTPVSSGRYPSKFGERLPADRYGWQTQGQPPGLSGNTGRPGGGSYAGTTFYEGSQAGDRFGSRPSYGSESSRKPNGYDSSVSGGYGYGNGAYGGYHFNRPTGYGGSVSNDGYGISGTLANGDEFGPVEPNYPEGNAPTHPNIQAQKAVALKALAGVALIGAAAALATNPILLPLGVIPGRRKRSNLSAKDNDAYMDYILTTLKSDATENYNNKGGNKMSLSPMCTARLTCEIQRNYILNFRKDTDFFKQIPALERRLINLISNNIPNEELVKMRIKKLIKAATIVASNGGSCNTFTCTFVKTKETKNPSILKL